MRFGPAALVSVLVGLTFTACGSGADVSRSPLVTGATQADTAVQANLAILYAHLHDLHSGTEAHSLLPDLTLVYTDNGHGNSRIPGKILPFRYWYSAAGDVTVSICAQDYTVFICPGRVTTLIDSTDWNACTVSESYRELETPVAAGQ